MNTQKISKLIKKVCTFCKQCQLEKDSFLKTQQIDYVEEMPKLYEKILIDIKGPIKYSHFKTNNNNNKMFYILAISEFISRYTIIIVINDIHSNTICDAVLKKWLQVYDTPKYCVTDMEDSFIHQIFQNYCFNIT
ncbi:Gypsy retrotransposon integrase-like protein 1 [Dictyocoela muelleri]|nr:Gypsy retrotransposon integrase-like protein 1 [Dictyocoela muelleri]